MSARRRHNGFWKTAVMGSVVFVLAIGFAGGSGADSPRDTISQVASPPSGASSPPSPFSAAPSNVCVTQRGVCTVTPPGTTRGAPCQRFVPPATWVPGVAEYWVSVPSVIP